MRRAWVEVDCRLLVRLGALEGVLGQGVFNALISGLLQGEGGHKVRRTRIRRDWWTIAPDLVPLR